MAIFDLGSFDPSLVTSGTINVNSLPGGRGTLVIYNDSPITIQIRAGARTKRILAGAIDKFTLTNDPSGPAGSVQWIQNLILSNAGAWPQSVVQIDGYTPDEKIDMRLPMAIPRAANVGNAVATTSSQSVVNDGNTAPSVVVEATPSGGSQSLLWNNDGSGKFGGGQWQVNSLGVFTAVKTGGLPLSALASGDLPAGVTVPLAQLDTGTLPSGITVPPARLSSGALPGGVTIAASSITSGALGSGVTSTNFPIIGTGNMENTPQISIIMVGPTNAALPAAGVKGRVAIVVPFTPV